ncbi:response regulator [Lyngbya sp. PCC 8106]|uniref:ATP-binding response regulator n=1 Tax=Lyngbya sp. (strain PCC 8106) TaxID=313612 RepID=UPI0000EACE73|nr:response regulator [Lyngbya sp. PCC 8106]EAW36079.1 Putative diguanylate phosphodiesterase (EAL domain) with Response Regulator Receiver modulation [Lyngbya sp. PCC 8106]
MKKILVIEDDEPIRMSILELLMIEQYQGIGAEDGYQGLELAKEVQPDLIICDIMMPGFDGYAVLNELQQESGTANIPFIFLTAKTERHDQRMGMELGADDYITKPFTTTELLEAVKTRLKKQQYYLSKYKQEQAYVQQLNDQVIALEQVSHSKEKQLTQLSEDLRAPLSTIQMAVELLSMAPSYQLNPVKLKEKQKRYLKILQEECNRELEILKQISNTQPEQKSPETKPMRWG